MTDDSVHSTERAPRLRADARRNRDQILLAARDVFADLGPDAPLEEVTRRAGVGIGTLYRRFPDRQALLRAVAVDIIDRVGQEAGLALAEEPDTFQALARYMHRALDLRVGVVMPGLVSHLSGEDAQLIRARDTTSALIQTIIDNAQAAGTLRPDVAFADIGLLIVRLSRPLPNSFPRALDDEFAHRHLDLLLDGLRAAPERSVAPLPGLAMTLKELRAVGDEIEAADPEHLPG